MEGERQKILGGGYGAARVAQQPYMDAINSSNSVIDSLFDRFRTPYSVKPVTVEQPNLSAYTVDRQALNANKQFGSDPNSPYAQFLQRRQEDEDERYV